MSLDRYLLAQEKNYQTALNEISQGRKKTHWMWYVFPQIQGLGSSPTAQKYAIQDMQEAIDFIQHPVLGRRLIKICDELLKLKTNKISDIFDFPDDLKLSSSITLFYRAEQNIPVFRLLLDKFFDGKEDIKTLKILGFIK